MKKRIISIILTVCTVLGLMPSVLLSAVAGSSTGSSSSLLEKMELQSVTEPDGFGADEGYVTPYGTKKNQAFTIQEFSEIFEYSSCDVNNSTAGSSTATLYNTKHIEWEGTDQYPIEKDSSINDFGDDYNYVQAVSLDPTGCGRRNYIAFVGYKRADKDIYVWFMNAETKKKVGNPVKIADADWIATNYLETVHARNFFQITAGDYDGDGKDTVVVYAGANQGAKLTAVTLNGTTVTAKVMSGYEHKSYSNVKGSYQVRNIMGMALYSGDVNGDGIDDLAALAYANNLSGTYSEVDVDAYVPQLTVAFGKDGASIQNLEKKYTAVGEFKNGQYVTMAAPGVAIGDIDGDGFNEIVVAGFTNYTHKDKKVNLQDGKVTFAAYNCDTGVVSLNGNIVVLDGNDVSGISKGDSLREDDFLWQQFAVECVQYGGHKTRELVFLNGYSYYLKDDGTLDLVDNSAGLESYFKNLKTHMDANGQNVDVDENFIYSMAVGNFNNSVGGHESIQMTVGYKTHNKNSTGKVHDYFFVKIRLYFQNAVSSSYTFNSIFCLFQEPVKRMFTRRGDALEQGLNCIEVAVDYDYDSAVARYSDKRFAYTDPEVIAVLQAAPYFEELGAENSSTEFSYSESYEKGTGSGTEQSFSVGFATEASAGPVKVAMDAGYAMELNEEYVSSRTWTYGTTFKANDQNQIILRRTLIYYYCYDVLDSSTKKWITGGLVVSVPQYPVMSSLNVNQYNEFANAYNSSYTGNAVKNDAYKKYSGSLNSSYKLDTISDTNIAKYYLNNEGNPYNYGKNYTDYGSNAFLAGHSQEWIELSHSGGTTEQFLQVDNSSSYTKVRSDGGYINMSAMVGGDFLFGEVWGGISTSMEILSSSITTETKVTTKGSGGEVQNLSEDLTDYKFNWKLVGWTTGSSEFFAGVPFIGYAVTGVSSPTNPVTDLSAEYSLNGSDETVALSWTAPTVTKGRAAITKFNVYRLTDSGETLLGEVANTGAGNTHALTADVSDYEAKSAIFIVRSVDALGNESIDSNEVNCQFNLSVREVQEMINSVADELTASAEAIKKLVTDGDTANSNELKSEIKKLTELYEKADKALNTRVDGTEKDIAALETALEYTDSVLSGLIKALDEKLDKAVGELNAAILKGDEDSADALAKAIEKLTEEYQAADALLDADIKQLSEETEKKLDELKSTLEIADGLLEAAIEKLKTDLETTRQELQANIDKNDVAMSERLGKLQAALDAAEKALKSDIAAESDKAAASDKDLQSEIDELKKELSELKDKTASDFETLNTELSALKSKISAQDSENENSIQALSVTDNTQADKLDTLQTVATVGLGVAAVSFLGNIVLGVLCFKKKKIF